MALPPHPPAGRRRRRAAVPVWRPVFTLLLGLGFVGAVFFYLLRVEMGVPLPGLAAPRSWNPGPGAERFAPLDASDLGLLQDQRGRVDRLARRHVGAPLTGASLEDLRVLQQILDRADLGPEPTYLLQALGVALGDVMAAQLGLHWVVFQDELGRSRALRLGESDVVIFPVTMISKRVELGVLFTVDELYRKTVREVEAARSEPPGRRLHSE